MTLTLLFFSICKMIESDRGKKKKKKKKKKKEEKEEEEEDIMLTCPCNFIDPFIDPFTSHFCIVKLGFTGGVHFSYFALKP